MIYEIMLWPIIYQNWSLQMNHFDVMILMSVNQYKGCLQAKQYATVN